jgi:hypothetical protein
MNFIYISTALLTTVTIADALRYPASEPGVVAQPVAAVEFPANASHKLRQLASKPKGGAENRSIALRGRAGDNTVLQFKSLRRMVTRLPAAAFFVLTIVILTTCVLFTILTSKPQEKGEWQAVPAEALLQRQGTKPSPTFPAPEVRVQETHSSPLASIFRSPYASTAHASFWQQLDAHDSGYQSPAVLSEHIVPQMVVREPGGAQFLLEGYLVPQRQQGFMEVLRKTADLSKEKVMRIGLSEQGQQDGISIELAALGNQAAAFLDTTKASGGAKNPQISIYECLGGPINRSSPFAVAKMESRGCTMRRPTFDGSLGPIISIMTIGGYNADYGNITDEQGKLMGTMSNRHRLGETTRIINVAEGVDVVLLIAVILCAVKLSQ